MGQTEQNGQFAHSHKHFCKINRCCREAPDHRHKPWGLNDNKTCEETAYPLKLAGTIAAFDLGGLETSCNFVGYAVE